MSGRDSGDWKLWVKGKTGSGEGVLCKKTYLDYTEQMLVINLLEIKYFRDSLLWKQILNSLFWYAVFVWIE